MNKPLSFLSGVVAVLTLTLSSGLLSPAQAVTVEQVISPKGVEAWLVQDHTNPMLSLEFSVPGGTQVEKKGGLATMVAGLLDEGAGPYDSQAFRGELDDRAIGLSFRADADRFRGSLKTLTTQRDKAFDLMRLALTEPRFDAEPISRVRAQLLASLAQEDSDPDAIAAKLWKKKAFGDHPYARPTKGTRESLSAITIADLKDYARHWLSRDGLKISVVGDITPAELAPLLDRVFAGLPAQAPDVPRREAQLPTEGDMVVDRRKQPQTVAMFGQAGPKRDDPDWYGAYVLNYILGGGGFSSRLMDEVREKRGLAYSTYSYLTPSDQAGVWIGGVSTENGRFAESLAVIREQWAKMANEGVTEKELADAKTYLTGSFPLQLDSTAAIARLVLSMWENNLGRDFLDRRNGLIEAVTQEDIRRIAKKWMKPEALLWVAVGEPEGLSTPPPAAASSPPTP